MLCEKHVANRRKSSRLWEEELNIQFSARIDHQMSTVFKTLGLFFFFYPTNNLYRGYFIGQKNKNFADIKVVMILSG